MSRKGPKLGALALIGNYSGESDSNDCDEVEEIVQTFSTNPVDIVTKIILADILPKVVDLSNKNDDVIDKHNDVINNDVMFIDHNPSFDVYRGRKREMSESSSVVLAETLDCTSDASSTSRLNTNYFGFKTLN